MVFGTSVLFASLFELSKSYQNNLFAKDSALGKEIEEALEKGLDEAFKIIKADV